MTEDRPETPGQIADDEPLLRGAPKNTLRSSGKIRRQAFIPSRFPFSMSMFREHYQSAADTLDELGRKDDMERVCLRLIARDVRALSQVDGVERDEPPYAHVVVKSRVPSGLNYRSKAEAKEVLEDWHALNTLADTLAKMAVVV